MKYLYFNEKTLLCKKLCKALRKGGPLDMFFLVKGAVVHKSLGTYAIQ